MKIQINSSDFRELTNLSAMGTHYHSIERLYADMVNIQREEGGLFNVYRETRAPLCTWLPEYVNKKCQISGKTSLTLSVLLISVCNSGIRSLRCVYIYAVTNSVLLGNYVYQLLMVSINYGVMLHFSFYSIPVFSASWLKLRVLDQLDCTARELSSCIRVVEKWNHG